MQTQVTVNGTVLLLPSLRVGDRTIIVTGRWLRLASILEDNLTGPGSDKAPISALEAAQRGLIRADIFTFAQSLDQPKPDFNYPFEWDNAAVIPITTYEEWIEKRAATDVRQNVRKAPKRGVTVRPVPFDDALVRGIVEIYNETPVRQGRPFWHYGKSFDEIKAETSHALDRSYFIGAYHGDELIGFVKLLRTGNVADLVLIVSKEKDRDKRPTNALIASSVQVCVDQHIRYLMYAQFHYLKKGNSSLMEFKRRHGFEPVQFPRYYVPLTLKGRVAVAANLHHGIKGILPERLLSLARTARARVHNIGDAIRPRQSRPTAH